MFMLPAFKTTLESIPPCPYITAPADRVEHWRQRLPRAGRRLVAIGWTSGGEPGCAQVAVGAACQSKEDSSSARCAVRERGKISTPRRCCATEHPVRPHSCR
jgi:hypothetical protein